ncbi:piggyBac transposable element-derived protein 4-like [Anastrepha obliqua]|uniref:piggyBac transposable element-derived protein 4-like n=1 Tax=Anastrepha obliqua TaxID=95512 RepID=UPI00240A6C85|nr:piggyBac transposable element-derived protein 4-like [Anastrepha obliqua]
MSQRDRNICRWLEESDSDAEDQRDEPELPNEDCSDVEDVPLDHVIESECQSDSEIDVDELCENNDDGDVPVDDQSSDDDVPLARYRNYFGKNRFRWSSQPPVSRSRTLQHNIIHQPPGLKRNFRDVLNRNTKPSDIWQLFFIDDMLEEIVKYTNEKIIKIRPNYQNQTCVHDLDVMELKALIGMLYYTAIFKENHTHYTCWYSTDGTGREIYRCIMSKNRFEILLNCLRFDDASTRDERRSTDKAAPISQLFGKLIQNCKEVCSIGSYACIDEMLVVFRGRCGFKMYMPKKPNKYGLKIMCMTDARNGYLVDGYIYLGKDSDSQGLPDEYQRLNKPTQSVLRLIASIEGTHRNVTTDNWFTSVELMKILKQKQLTLVGTLKKNKREVPPQFLPSRHRDVGSSIFGFTSDATLVSYVPKQNKSVLVLSSMHHMPTIDPQKQKPEMITFYNSTKGGVDTLDQKCAIYSTSRRTQRWPMAVFYRMLDVSAANSYIISNMNQAQRKVPRLNFMKQLAKELIEPHLRRRVNQFGLQRDLQNAIRRVLKIDEEPRSFSAGSSDKLETRKTCSTCDPKKKRKTFHLCFQCKNPICVECSQKMCISCRDKL